MAFQFLPPPLNVFGPNRIVFTPQINQAISTEVLSNIVTLSGSSNEVWPFLISGSGSPLISINSGSWVNSGFAINGYTIQAKLTSSGSNNTEVDAVLVTNGQSSIFRVTTIPAPPVSVVANHHVHWAKINGNITVGIGDDLDSIPDISGNGNNFNYLSGSKAKLQQDSGGRYYAEFTADGLYRMSALSDNSTWSWVGSYLGVTGPTGGRLISSENVGINNSLLGTWSPGDMQLIGQSYLGATVSLEWPGGATGRDLYHYDNLVQNGSGALYYNDGVDVTQVTGNTMSLNPGGMNWSLGGYSSNEYYRGRFYGDCWSNVAWNPGQQADANTYINSPSLGV